ncbi:thioesterase family protein [Nesterenkonia sp. HG001]|uniref:acyl-CoA thioesterase n=1 Tax=Nesterenkonia sp. HG001 TaxID=2983207 RepID=UPI002AC5F3BB|nr:thioesterase family protein [Nesterenkonia sp. HG001]MDZ5077276.1 acyl-CoA thioesterase [Nesterenkonia sp. HG001]
MTRPGRAFVCPMPLRWSDQDLNAHVNNAKVVTLFEEARLQASAVWFRQAPQGPRLVRSLTVDYLHPLLYGEATTAHVWISRIGRTSFVVHHDLLQRGQACATGRSVMVHVDAETGQPTPIGPEMREALAAALIPDENSADDGATSPTPAAG